MFETTIAADVLELARPGSVWLSTGWRGGRTRADAAHSITVPEGWRPDETHAYVDRRLAQAGFDRDGPVLFTGVAAEHARGARLGPVEAYATAGLSNPAALPTDPAGGALPDGEHVPGTVNVVVGAESALAPGAMANLVAVAAEARATTLLDAAGVPGTSTDATVVVADPDGPQTEFSGAATRVGAAARACVREAVGAALDARYDGAAVPTPREADHAIVTDARAEVFRP